MTLGVPAGADDQLPTDLDREGKAAQEKGKWGKRRRRGEKRREGKGGPIVHPGNGVSRRVDWVGGKRPGLPRVLGLDAIAIP